TSFLYHYYCPYRYYSGNITKNDGWNKNPPFYIFSSYYDDRDSDFFLGRPVLQIISSAYNSSYVNDKDYYCHFFDSTTKNYLYSSPIMVRTLWNRAWDPRLSFYTSFLLTCPIKRNNMNVVFNVGGPYCPNKDLPLNSFVIPQQSNGDDIKITTCVKGLDFDDDLSIKLIEWIEWQKYFGVNHVTFYLYKVHSNMDKVLKYYVDSGYVTVIPITLPGYQPNDPEERSLFIRRNKQQKRRNELIPYNDCFYRHLKDSQYILIIDIDEIVVTMNNMKYQEMIKLIPDYKYSSVMVQNVFKFKNDSQILDKNLPLGSHKYRCKDSQGKEAYAKPFISTKYASSVFTHFAFHKQVNGTKKFYLPKEIGIKLHFKDTCPSESMYECDKLLNSTIDDDLLISRSKNVRENIIKVGLSLKLIN
uniref:Glycosyltransferase family 92 protein n=1 Tax=Strongyloides venezuelensis TaxID=75913 RepID=A0A0K0FWK7_STRVS